MESLTNRPKPRSACPACAGELIQIRAKLQYSRCHIICETCCGGGQSAPEGPAQVLCTS